MNYDIDKAIGNFPGIGIMLDGLDRSLWEIFLPQVYENLVLLEINILTFVSRAGERDRVMAVQDICELPLRPNASLSETMAKARKQGQKNSKLLDKFKKRRKDDSSDFDA